jgi:RimJ/RimL family protein N-acetyltransferase
MDPIGFGKVQLRLVTEEDAAFIVSIRTDKRISRYLSVVSSDENQQRLWIWEYKKREAANEEYYFIVMDEGQRPIGTVRLYDFVDTSFSWGSWVIIPDAPVYSAIETVIAVYDFGFRGLGFVQSHFAVRNENVGVLRFHKRFGAELVSEDHLECRFKLTREQFEIRRSKLVDFLAR